MIGILRGAANAVHHISLLPAWEMPWTLGPDLTGLSIQRRDLLHLRLGAHNTCEEEVKITEC